MTPVEIFRGDGPVLLAMPHTGTWLPDDALVRLNARGRMLSDTDWHIDRLYDGLLPGATVVRATVHRYLIDANRDPSGRSLYPGQNTTGLVPMTDFDGADIWDRPPDAAEIERRRAAFHAPYHEALAEELARLRAAHGTVVLYDCHSIRPVIPHLFDGTLPDLNIGTNGGKSCAPGLGEAVEAVCAGAAGYSSVLNGRFKGGWTTRHHGRPETGVHAVQMELSQSAYLAEAAPPWVYDPARADRLRAVLSPLLATIADWAQAHG